MCMQDCTQNVVTISEIMNSSCFCLQMADRSSCAAVVCKTCPLPGTCTCPTLSSPPVLKVPVPIPTSLTPEEHPDQHGKSLSPTNDRMHVMCVEGHGRSICFEVKSFEDGLPEWVQKWVDDVATGGMDVITTRGMLAIFVRTPIVSSTLEKKFTTQ